MTTPKITGKRPITVVSFTFNRQDALRWNPERVLPGSAALMFAARHPGD